MITRHLKVKAVIFDLDGLIIDSEPIHSKSLELMLKKYGKVPVYRETGLIHIVGGPGRDEDLDFIEQYQLNETQEALSKTRRKIYEELLKAELSPMPGFMDLIKMLKKRQVKTAIASQRFIRHIRLILKKFEVMHLFDKIVTPGKNIRPKPTPDTYLAAAKRLKVKPNECVVLEDSETGITAGKDAGMKVIAVPTIYTKDQDLSRADLIVNSLKDIKWGTISKL